MAEHQKKPRPQWVLSVSNLPQDIKPARYEIRSEDGQTREVTLSKRKRQVIDALLKNELFCASTVRIGDVVFRLKSDEGVMTSTRQLPNGRAYYALADEVTFIGEVAA